MNSGPRQGEIEARQRGRRSSATRCCECEGARSRLHVARHYINIGRWVHDFRCHPDGARMAQTGALYRPPSPETLMVHNLKRRGFHAAFQMMQQGARARGTTTGAACETRSFPGCTPDASLHCDMDHGSMDRRAGWEAPRLARSAGGRTARPRALLHHLEGGVEAAAQPSAGSMRSPRTSTNLWNATAGS
eukprot:scaffold4967_cov116-Isochrysis_galbana.AAC.2